MRGFSWGLLLFAVAAGCSSGTASPDLSGSGGEGNASAAPADAEARAQGAPAGSDKTLRIAVIPKGTSHEFWKSVHAGAQNAAAELGNIEVIWRGPAQENDIQGQIEVVKNLITRRVDAICLAPNHSESLVEAVNEANDEGIPVVIFDSGLGKGPQIVSYVATDNEKGGQMAAARLAEVLGDQGDVILMRYNAGSESTEQRERGFLEEIAKHPNVKVLSSDQYGGTSTKSAMDKGLQLLLRYQDEVDGVFAVCEPNCNGMLEALEQSGLASKVKFVAFDPSDRLIKGLESGKVHGIVLQDPVHMGYRAVKAAVAKLRGERVEPRIATGEYVATSDNMRTEQYQKLLHPQLAE
jgi:ribose transport system substrate-binding protein